LKKEYKKVHENIENKLPEETVEWYEKKYNINIKNFKKEKNEFSDSSSSSSSNKSNNNDSCEMTSSQKSYK
jgi:hypothetical protein